MLTSSTFVLRVFVSQYFQVCTPNMSKEREERGEKKKEKLFLLRNREHLLRRNTRPFQVRLRLNLHMGTVNDSVILFPIYFLGIVYAVWLFTYVAVSYC